MAPSLTLLTDLYELTMMQGYLLGGTRMRAVFEMFFRSNPFQGGYAVFAGLAPLVEELISLRFTDDDIGYLRGLRVFEPSFLEYLSTFRFNGDLQAVDEGTVVFPNEPLVRIEGDIVESQFIESMLLNIVNFQTLIATKSSRMYHAARGGSILEFGLRRAQGVNGALAAARAAFIGGASATSNVLAGKEFGIPVAGTMAHSWVMAFPDERQAFREFARRYPDRCILLVDTIDTLGSGLPNAISVFRELGGRISVRGIRLDSGDLEYLSKRARAMLDDAGMTDVKIVVSNELDEQIITHLVAQNAPIDSWGVGTHLVTAKGDPSLTGVYKLVARERNGAMEPVIKVSNSIEKSTNPGRKNIARFYNGDNIMMADLIVIDHKGGDPALSAAERGEAITLHHPIHANIKSRLEGYARHELLLKPVIRAGSVCTDLPNLSRTRDAAIANLAQLDETHKRFINPHVYKVSLSDALRRLKDEIVSRHAVLK